MKNLILTVILMITTVSANAQGIITVENAKSNVPVEQWYVIRNKEFDNNSYFYGERNAVREELKNILSKDDQSIEFPKGKDEDGDSYWIIMYENEFTTYFYLSELAGSEFSTLITATK